MKVIFIEDVPNVARAGEAKEVADGYGRNFLLPRKLAVLDNSQASAVVEAQLKKRERLQAQNEAQMAEVAGKLNGMEVTLKARAGARGRLYGSITSADIADELSRAGQVVDKRKIELEEPIHQLGSYDVTVRFTHEISALLKLIVAGEEVEEEKEEKKAKAKVEKREEEKAEDLIGEKEEKKAKAKAKAEKREEKTAEMKEEKKEEKKTKVKAEKKEEKETKKEKKVRVKKKVEETGEKDAEPGK